MKKIMAVCLSLILCFSVIPVSIFAAETSGVFSSGVSWEYDSGSQTLSMSGNGDIDDFKDLVSIPWKSYSKEIKNINISEGVTGIGDYALSWCENVTSIVLPSTVARIGVDAFGWCSNLKNITLSDNLKTIDSEAFAWCKSLETIEIPANVNDIDSKAFLWCYSLESITVNSSNNKYKSFDGVLFDTEENSLVSYPPGKGNAEYTVPENIAEIEESAFMDNKILTGITIGNIKEIGDKAFFGCEKLYDINILGVEEVGELAFYRCSSMVKIILPENTRAVGKNAFKNCTNLELAAFYGNDTKFDKDVFEGASQAAIAGNEHSSVMKYANNNEIPFYQIVNVIYGGNNVNFDPMAFVVNNSTTLVPMRAVFEMLGADVDWDETSSTAIASKDGITISIQIGSSILYRNGEAITLSEAGRLTADKTYVPLRAVSEAFGNDVQWDGETAAVIIN